MKRSESAKTTLSMYATKAGKYQKWIGMVNVLLLLSSLVLLFTGIILRLNYFMDNLGFISVYFEVKMVPSLGWSSKPRPEFRFEVDKTTD